MTFKHHLAERPWVPYAAAVVILLVDAQIELGVAGGVLYVFAVWLAYATGKSETLWSVALLCSFLTLAGLVISPHGGELWKALINRILIVIAIWAVALQFTREVFLRNQWEKELGRAEAALKELRDKQEQAIRKRRAMVNILEDLNIERQKVREVTSELSFPPQNFTMDELTVELNQFSMRDMVRFSRTIRALGQQHDTESKFGKELVDLIYDRFRSDNGETEFALVRLFRSQRMDTLEPNDVEFVQTLLPDAPSSTQCLKLAATRGDLRSWNDPSLSARHRVIPCDVRSLEQLPMIRQMLWELGVDAELVAARQPQGSKRSGFFHVEDAADCSDVPDQEEFVRPYGIKSVVGCGGKLAEGGFFVVLGFSKAPISQHTAQLFSHLAHSTRVALSGLAKTPQRTVAQIRAVQKLVANHEEIVADQEARLLQTLAQLEETNRELEQFAYIASHDLQEPLRKISAFSQLLREEFADQVSEEAHHYMEVVIDGAERLKTLVSDLLTFSRVTTHGKELVPVDSNACLEGALSNLEVAVAESDATVTHDGLPFVLADSNQLRSLFQNLVGNAIKYRGGKSPRIHIGCRENGSFVEFSIQDNGIGIEPQYFDRVFEIFKRLHGRSEYAGTGIGLALCKRIVERFGGKIWLDSSPGCGSTFYCTLEKAPTEVAV